MRRLTDQYAGLLINSSSSKFSRRRFIEALALGTIGLATTPRIVFSSEKVKNIQAEFGRIAGLVTQVQSQQPNLPGFRNVSELAARTLPQNMPTQAANALQGALYLKAASLLKENQKLKIPAPSLETVRLAFTEPDLITCFTPEYFDDLLRTTQGKMIKDQGFARKVEAASEEGRKISPIDSQQPLAGIPIIVIVVIIIILVSLPKEAKGKKNKAISPPTK